MSVNDQFKSNRKSLFQKASELPQPKKPESSAPVFEREPHQCPHLQGPTFQGSSINFCDLMNGITCIKAIYNVPEQYKSCIFEKIYNNTVLSVTEDA